VNQKPKSIPKFKLDLWLIIGLQSIAIALAVLLIGYEKWILEPKIKNQEKREAVGQIKEQKSSPKRRYGGSLTYFDVKAGEHIYLGDTIFVDSTSALEFKLSTGSVLRLGALTLVLIDRENNQIKLIVNSGEIDGTIADKDKLSFEVNEDQFELEAEKGSQFKISKSELKQSSITGTKGKIKLRYRDEVYDITDTKFTLGEGQSAPKNVPPPPTPVPTPIAATLAPSMDSEPVNLDEIPIDVPIPYPPNNQLYLIKKSATILVLPRRICTNDCSVALFRGQEPVGQWAFKKDSAPLIKLTFTPQEFGTYTVKLKDGADQETKFDVKGFSPSVFEKAIKAGTSVELLD
jgi:hypothetical protein